MRLELSDCIEFENVLQNRVQELNLKLKDSKETLNVGNAGGLVIWIPNEAHEPLDKRMSEKNGVFLPMKAIISNGCQVAWVSDDKSHSHTEDHGHGWN